MVKFFSFISKQIMLWLNVSQPNIFLIDIEDFSLILHKFNDRMIDVWFQSVVVYAMLIENHRRNYGTNIT